MPKAPVTAIPENISWSKTTLVRSTNFAASPPPQWAIDSVQASFDAFKANADTPALTTTLADEAQARAVLHQLRRAAAQIGCGLAAKIDDKVLTFQAKDKKIVTPKIDIPKDAPVTV